MRRSVSLLLSLLSLSLLLSGAAALGAGRRQRDWDGALNRGLRAQRGSGNANLQASKDIQPQFFTQRLDHFDALNTATFQQLFYVNDAFYNPSSPLVFLMVGGEGPISPAYVSGHFHMGDLAQQFGALQVTLEHRFYGQSVPNNDSSTQNLRFLSSQQALEDLAAFHSYITSQYDEARWVVFGGSYPGSLSAWARAKYPHLYHASFSASAPVLAQLNFVGYLEVVDLSVGDECSQRIREGMNTIASLLATDDGRAKLVSMFNLCAAPASKLDAANVIEMLVDPIAEQVQYSLDGGKPYDAAAMCQRLLKPADPVQPLIDMWQENYGGSSGDCVDASYAGLVSQLGETGAMRSWTWQTCTEFGYFQSGESPDQPFPASLSLDYFLAQCRDVFGLADESFQPAIDRTNTYYGGIDLVTSNTFFTQGTVDPWHRLGTYHGYNAWDYSTSVLINGTAHCADMYLPTPKDLPGLTAARQQQLQMLQKWLAQPQRKRKTKLAEL